MRNLILISSIFVLTGCGAYSDYSPPSVTALDVDGQWATSCHPTSMINGGYLAGYMTMYAGSMHKVYSWNRAKADCSTEDILITVDATYKVGDKVTVPVDTYAFESTITKVTMRPRTDAWAAGMNNSKVCGRSDWMANIDRDVTGLNCNPYLPLNYNRFGIIHRAMGDLYFGMNTGLLDGSTPERRPTVLNTEEIYTLY